MSAHMAQTRPAERSVEPVTRRTHHRGPLDLRLACANVRRSVSSYSIYFVTIVMAVCLLYTFTSSGTFLSTLDLTGTQLAILANDSMNQILSVFSLLVVIVFAALVVGANRYLVRRRKREFALYGLLGMAPRRISHILALECGIVGLGALAVGLVAGVVLSPLFGLVTAYVFDVPWRFSIVVAPGALAWTCGCFIVITLLSALVNMVDIRKCSLRDLMDADRAGEKAWGRGKAATVVTLVGGLAAVGFVWFVCVALPDAFLMAILPICILAYFGTKALLRGLANVLPRILRGRRSVYLRGLTCFVTRQTESKVVSSCSTLTSVCVLMALGVCLVAGGLAFCAGAHGAVDFASVGDPATTAEQAAEVQEAMEGSMAIFAFISLFYGVVFLVAAAAALALQQLTQTADSRASYQRLSEVGSDERQLSRAVHAQVGVYFLVPLVMALIHDVFGMQFVAYLTGVFGTGGLVPAVPVFGLTLAVVGAYYLVTCRQCWRSVEGTLVGER